MADALSAFGDDKKQEEPKKDDDDDWMTEDFGSFGETNIGEVTIDNFPVMVTNNLEKIKT